MKRGALVVGVALVALAALNVVQYATRPAPPPPAPAPPPPVSPEPAAAPALKGAGLQALAQRWARGQSFFSDNEWLGIQARQNPLDVWITQEIIAEVEPDFVVETGTARGGSALLWATVLAQVNPDGRVLTVDIEDLAAEAKQLPLAQRRIDFFLGSSTDPAIVDEIRERVGDGRAMVILDSAHNYEHVLAELRAYAPLVPVGSYLIVQDTGYVRAVNTRRSGAAGAVREFLAEDDRFAIDRKRERFQLTNNPSGFLRRVR